MLNTIQKNHLKTLAHHLQPVVMVGANGLTEAVLREAEQALLHHELLKIRVNAGDRSVRNAIITEIGTTLDAEIIQRVGHVAVLFRRNPETPRVSLP